MFALDHQGDVVRLGIQRIPNQLENRLDRLIAVREPKDQVVLGVDVEPLHGCRLPHHHDSAADLFGGLPRGARRRAAVRAT
jgi:hypothetical protein